jgi:RNA polymerase sigma-70 factor (ECF subfamily)
VALIEGLRARDRKATAEFVDRFAGPVEQYLRSRLWPRTDLIDDVAQEVFLAAWERLDSFRGESPIRAWLLGIARHKVEDHYRAVLRAQPVPVEDIDAAPDGQLSIDDELDRTRMEDKLRAALAELTPPYGVLLLWRYWEKRSLREMAAETGRTEKAVERLLARAREQFRSKWNAEAGRSL